MSTAIIKSVITTEHEYGWESLLQPEYDELAKLRAEHANGKESR